MLNIRDLSKEIDMTAVRGGTSLVGQVVPTNLQSNELLQKFNVVSNGPVSIGNDANQSNYASMDTFSPVGSFIGMPAYWY
jgi:hypothetical protein